MLDAEHKARGRSPSPPPLEGFIWKDEGDIDDMEPMSSVLSHSEG